MKKIAIVGLVVLILLLVIPLGIGMAMGACPECPAPEAAHVLLCCLALVIAVALGFLAVFMIRMEPSLRAMPVLLLTNLLDRPPRAA